MAGKTTRVTAIIGAKVEGDKDLKELAKQLADMPDEKAIEVAAEVTGDKDVDGLAKAVSDLPNSADVSVAAKVTGDTDVSALDTDLAALPSSTDTTVAAKVTGDETVDGLATDLKALPASTDTKVDTTLTGEQELDALVTKLAGLPASTNVRVAAVVSGGDAAGALRDDLDSLGDEATGAGGEVSGMASEITSTLGGPFSEGTAMAGDFAEQFRNLKAQVAEAGGGLKNWGKALGGIGATIGVGLLIDPVISLFSSMSEGSEQAKEDLGELTEAALAAGGVMSSAFKEVKFDQIWSSEDFAELRVPKLLPDETLVGALMGDPNLIQSGLDALAAARQQTIDWGVASGEDVTNQIDGIDRFTDAFTTSVEERGFATKTAIGDAQAELRVRKALGVELEAQAESTGALKGSYETLSVAQQEAADEAFLTYLSDQQAAAEGVAQAEYDSALAAAESQAAHTVMAESMAAVDEATSSAARELDGFLAIIDEITGRNRSLEEATAGASEGIRDIADAAKEVAAGDLVVSDADVKNLADWNVEALTATESGADLYDMFSSAADGIQEETAATYSSVAATGDLDKAKAAGIAVANRRREAFLKEATAMGIPDEAAKDLADSLGVLDGSKIDFDILADDKDAQKDLKKAQDAEVPDKQFEIDGDSTPAEQVLKALDNKAIADKVQKILGNKTDADTKINALIALGIPEKEAKIIAETSGVDAARQEIQGVADGYYEAEVKVTTTFLGSGWDYLFGTRPFPGLSVSTNGGSVTTQGLAGTGLGVSAGVTTMAAPTATRLAARASQVTAGPTIVVNGALDPDAVARQISRLLRNRDRRTGPIVVGKVTL